MEEFLWYGMEKNCRYGIRKNHLPFHSMPCSMKLAPLLFTDIARRKETKALDLTEKSLIFLIFSAHKNIN